MNDLRALTDGILAKAKTEAEGIIQTAESESARIIAEAKERATARRQKIAEDYQRKSEELERRGRIEVELESKKRMLATKHQLIRKAFEQALEGLKNLPAEKRLQFLAAKLAAAGVKNGGEVKGSGAPAEWSAIIKAANEKLAHSGSSSQFVLSNQQPEFEGGFLLTGSGYVVNGSYQAILEEVETELIPKVADLLFKDEKR